MPEKRILFISGSAGLGHITRDLAIAGEIRKLISEARISWLAGPPAKELLVNVGEQVLPESDRWGDETSVAEGVADKRQGRYSVSVVDWLFNVREVWEHDVNIFEQVIHRYPFDLVIGDETYGIARAVRTCRTRINATMVMIYDFIGVDIAANKLKEKLGAYITNRRWALEYRGVAESVITLLFIGEKEDVPDRSFGYGLPNRRAWANAHCHFLGYVLPFEAARYANRDRIRHALGYGREPLVVCSIGGTSIGKNLLELCSCASGIVRKRIPELRMVIVCGPRLSPDELKVEPGVEVRGFVPNLHEHFAASDLAIVQGGGTTTVELTALRRPFLFFPLEGHFEQQLHVAARLARHQAGLRMSYSETTPEILAETILANLGKDVSWPPIPTDGARNAAHHVLRLLAGRHARPE
jgi:predicted glycosyltransferase